MQNVKGIIIEIYFPQEIMQRNLEFLSYKNKFLEKWDKSYKEYSISKYKFEVKATILSKHIDNYSQLMTYGLTVYFLYLVYIGKLDVGEFVFLNSIMWSLTNNIGYIVNILSKELAEKLSVCRKI